MNKLKQLFFIGLTFLMPTMVFAQSGAPTLTQDWKNTSGLPVQGTASYGVGYNGTVYVNYTTGELQAFSNGSSSTVTTGLGGGKGITRDSKGNLLILDKSIGSTSSMNSVKLYNATTKELSSSINITLPEDIIQVVWTSPDVLLATFSARQVLQCFSVEMGKQVFQKSSLQMVHKWLKKQKLYQPQSLSMGQQLLYL